MTEVVLGSYWHAVLQSSGSEHATSAYIDALRKRAVRLYWSSFVLNTVLLWTAAGSLTAGISVGVSIGQLLAGSAIPLFLAFCLTLLWPALQYQPLLAQLLTIGLPAKASAIHDMLERLRAGHLIARASDGIVIDPDTFRGALAPLMLSSEPACRALVRTRSNSRINGPILIEPQGAVVPNSLPPSAAVTEPEEDAATKNAAAQSSSLLGAVGQALPLPRARGVSDWIRDWDLSRSEVVHRIDLIEVPNCDSRDARRKKLALKVALGELIDDPQLKASAAVALAGQAVAAEFGSCGKRQPHSVDWIRRYLEKPPGWLIEGLQRSPDQGELGLEPISVFSGAH